ncbi:hypothetical protein PENTCL1PPCAC_13565 [Pristionchus entomophagus]|nr:hypothetical protein PENTCL1PPCAC_13565 [Pristionchus entomophagus]
MYGPYGTTVSIRFLRGVEKLKNFSSISFLLSTFDANFLDVDEALKGHLMGYYSKQNRLIDVSMS